MQLRADQEALGRDPSSLQRILQFDFAEPSILEQLEKFEHMIELHDEQNNTLREDELKLAGLLHAILDELRVSVYSTPSNVNT